MEKYFKISGAVVALVTIVIFSAQVGFALGKEEVKKKEDIELQQKFTWWPTDATPGPVQDKSRGGYWWWPSKPGPKSGNVWGNRGFCYVRKVIFDYKEEELPAPRPDELRPSLLIRKIIKNIKVYFDYDKANVREDTAPILDAAVNTLKKNPEADILITGNCDIRGTEKYNEKLGRLRGESVKEYMLSKGIPEERIKIISRGKLDAIAPVTDLVGMQKDRNAQFMIAEVEETMIPYTAKPPEEATPLEEGTFVEEKEEKLEGKVRVSTREYVIQKGDSLWKIAEKELGSGYRWQYLYELNKDIIKNPKKLRAGQTIIIPIE